MTGTRGTPRGKQEVGLLSVGVEVLIVPREVGPTVLGSRRATPFQWDGVREGIREEVALQLCLVEDRTAHAKG